MKQWMLLAVVLGLRAAAIGYRLIPPESKTAVTSPARTASARMRNPCAPSRSRNGAACNQACEQDTAESDARRSEACANE